MAKRVKKFKINKQAKIENSKREYLKLAVLGIFFIAIIFGASYGFLSTLNEGRKAVDVVSGTLAIEYEDGNNINLTNASPLSDKAGMETNSYTFSIENTGTLDGKYNIILEEKDTNTLDRKYVKYSIKQENGQWSTPAYLNTGLTLTSNKVIIPQEYATYELKMWLDENAPNEVQGQKYEVKIVVNTVQTNATIEDVEIPIIVLNGNSVVNIEKNQEFVDPGISVIKDQENIGVDKATIKYEYSNGVTTIPVDNVDTSKVGTYYIYYSATDSKNNTGITVRAVNVYEKDTTPPTIALIGDETVVLDYGEKYVELGVVADDDKDENINNKIITHGKVNSEISGVYVIKYIVIDSNGNTASTTRQVIVKDKYEDLEFTVEKEETSIIKNTVYLNVYTESDTASYAVITHDGKPTDSEYVVLNNKENNKFSTNIELVRNGKYTIWVKDGNKKIKSKEVTVTNIDETKPVCTFSKLDYIGIDTEKEITLTCTDPADITDKSINKDSFKINSDIVQILDVTKMEKIENGYIYTLNLKAVSAGEVDITLPANTINDKAGNLNEKATSNKIKVSTISVEKPETTIDISGKNEYKINVTGSNMGKVTYASENENIATVTADGVIKGINPGKTQINLIENNGNSRSEIIIYIEKTLTATFVKNGTGVVSIGSESATCKLTYTNPDKCDIIGPQIDVKEGYTALGWNTDKNSHESSKDVSLTDNTTFYSISKKNTIVLTANFNKNGATLSDEKSRSCELVEVYNSEKQATSCKVTTPTITGSSNTPIVLGFSYDKPGATEASIISGGELELTEENSNHIWYAITRNDSITYETIFEKNSDGIKELGSTKLSCTIPITYNGIAQDTSCEITLPTITANDGYTALGWNEDRTSHEASLEGANYTISKNTTMYAILRKDEIVYTANFIKSGHGVTEIGATNASCTLGAVYNNETQATSCNIKLPSITVKEGYTALGWSQDQNTHEDFIKIEDGITLTQKEITLYSITRKEDVNLVFHVKSNGAVLSSDNDLTCTLEAVYNNEAQATSCEVDFPTIIRETYDILGYSIEDDNQDLEYQYIKNASRRKMDITENGTTYYANTKKDVRATWDSNGTVLTSTKSSCTIWNNRENCIVKTPEISRDTFEIIGWSTNKDATENDEIIDVKKEVKLTDNIVYYAITKKIVTITFNKNNALSQDESTEEKIEKECTIRNINTTCDITSPKIIGNENTPITVGYNEDKDAITSTYNESTVKGFSENTKYYAITRNDPITYKVTYEKSGAGVELIGSDEDTCTIPITYNGKKQDETCNVTLPNIEVKEGYTPIGWNEDKTAHTGGKIGTKYTIGKDTILYSISRKDAIVYSAKFIKSGLGVTAIGKTTDSCTLEAVYNDEEQATSCKIDLPSITVNDGYTVLGWSEDQTTHDNFTKIVDGITLTKRNTSLYSITRKDAIPLTFHVKANGSTLSSDKDLTCTLEAVYNNEEQATKCNVTFPTIIRDTFDILGFSTEDDNQDLDYEYIENTATRQMDITENGTTYYANTKKDVSATWNSNGAVLTSNKSSCTIWNNRTTCSVTTPEITRVEFEIIGWSTNKDATENDEIIGMNKEIKLTDSINYYAITKKNITITFNKNNAVSQDESTAEEVTRTCIIRNSSTACNIISPKIVGSDNTPIVVGYNKDKDAIISTYNQSTTMSFDSNQKFYAITKNNPITYNVTYDKNGVGVSSIEKDSDSCTIPSTYNGKKQDETCKVKLPSISVKDGFTVIGWNEDKLSHIGSKVDSEYIIGKHTTLFAISRKDAIVYTAKFVKSGLGVTAIGKTTDSCTLAEVYNNEKQETTCDIKLPSISVEGLWKVLGWSEDQTTHDNYTIIEDGITLTKIDTTLYSITKKEQLILSAAFNANGATLSTNEGVSCTLEEVYNNEARDDHCILTTPEVSRDNFDFIGYNQNPNSHENDDSYDKDANQIRLDVNNTGKAWYAITKRDLTVKYNKNGVQEISKTEDGCTIWNSAITCSITLPDITRDTFDIIGWNEDKDATIDSDGTIEKQSQIQIDDHKSYYAITKKDIVISYHKNNSIGQTNSLGEIVYDEIVTRECRIINREETCSIKSPSIVAPYATPNVVGYGISSDSTTSSWNVNITKNVTDNADYYAVTKNNDITYKADFVKQGLGVIGITSNTTSCTIDATYNGKIQPTTCRIALPNIIVEDGYTALGWSTNQEASTDFINASTIDLDKNITLYAISKKNEVILTATFYKNGAASQTLFSNGTIVTSTDDKVKVSCSLDESFNDDLQAKSCIITAPIINASDETPDVIGYATTNNATEKSLTPNTQLIITKDVDYYAITKKSSVTFSADFDANNSTLSSTTKLSCNIAATYNGVAQAKSCTVNAPTITANKNTPTIVGFNLDSNATTNNTNYNLSTKKLTLNSENTGKVWYAITKKNTVTYTVNYKIGDHVTSISKTSGKCVIPETYNGVKQTTVCIIREDDAENNPKITPNVGYTSIGWSQLSSSTVGSPAVVLSKDNMTFYAHASANHYNINYYSDNRLIGTMSVTYDEPFTLQTIEELNLTKRGYTFNSWTSAGVTYKDGVKVSTNLASEEGANVRFDANWDDLEKPICRFVQVGTTTTQNQTIVKMECTDTGSGVVKKTLSTSDFTVSNTTNGIIDSVSAPTAITDGYSYDLTVRGLSVGTFDITIPANKIVDNWNNGILSAKTPTSVVVNGRVYTIKYTKGDNVAAIAATSASCTTEGASIVCNVYLPGITASTGYTPKGWLNVRNVTTGIGESYELTENTTGETLTATSVDITPPKCSISGNPTAWTQSAVLTVSATDDGSGLDNAPYSWTSKTEGFSTTTTKTITANGEYKAYAKDKWGNVGECSVTATKIDTTKPSCSFSNFSDTTIVAGNTATIDLTCTDTQSLIDTTTNKLSTKNFAVSAAYAKVTNVTAPTAVTNGYKYTVTVEGVSYGAFNISLNANSFKDIADNYNAKVTSSNATAYNKATTGSCNNLTYNGSAQTLASGGTGITFSNNSQINANTYTVTMTPTAQYKYSDEATSKNINCTISQKDVTYTADSASKTYDGTALTKTTATLTSGSLVSGHTATPSITGTITNVGSTTNTLNGITIKSGSTDVTSNYKITKVNGTLTVNKRTTTCTATTTSKTYDGSSLSSSTGTCDNIVSGQTVTFTNSGSITNVGSTTNTLSSVTIKSGTTDVTSNYTITKKNGTLTVNKRATTCTAGSSSKVYDGKALANATGGSCTNLVSGHTAAFTNTGSITNVGSTSNTVSSVVIKSGTTDVSGNYTITKATGTLTVTKANATNPTISPYSGTYDGASHSITVSGGSGGTIQYSTDNSTWSTTKPTRTSQGTTTVYVKVVGDSNHNSTTAISSTITISKRAVTCTSSGNSKTYDGTALTQTSGGSCTNIVSGHTATFTNAGSIINAGTASNTVSSVVIKSGTTDVSSNYTITKVAGTLTVNKRAATCTSGSTSKTYDGTALTSTSSGSCTSLVSGHTATFTNTGTITNVGNTTNTLNAITIKSGTTDVTSNYKINKANGTLTVNKRTTTCSAATTSKTYDGTALTSSTGTCDNVVSGQTITFANTGSVTNVGSTTNTLNSVTIKSGTTDVTSNYTITKKNGTLTVNKRATTCTAGSSSKVYDGTALSNTTGGSCTNLVSGHAATFANTGSITNVGSTTNTLNSVAIKSGTTDVASNYTITKKNGTLTITKANATNPTIKPYSGTYDGASHTITVSGGSGGTIQYSTDNATWSTTKPTRTSQGTTTVYVRVLGDSNHNTTTSISTSITIAKRAVTCTSSGGTKTYDGTALTNKTGGSCTNLVSGHAATFTNTGTVTSATSVANTVSSVVIKSGTTDVSSNYTITKVAGTLTVNKRATTCTSSGGTKTYDGTALTNKTGGSCTNLVSGHAATFTNTGTVTNATSVANTVSSVVIKSGTTDVSGNYSITKATGTLSVTKANPTISLSDTKKTYNGSAQGVSATVNSGGALSYTYYTNNTCTTQTTTATGASAAGKAPIDAGTYYAKATAAATSNYNSGTSRCVKLTINPKSLSVTWGATTTFTMNSTAQAPTASVTSGVTGETVNVTRTTATAVGNHTSTASISSVTGGRAKTANYTLTNNTRTFVILGITYTATYNANSATISGGKTSCTTTGTNTSCSVTAPTITRTGYTVKGWNTSSTATTASVSSGGSITLNSTNTGKTWYAITVDDIKPSTPSISSVTNNATSLVVKFTGGTDSGSGLARHVCSYGTTSSVTTSVNLATTANSCTFSTSTGTTYYYRICTYDNANNSSCTTVQNTKTWTGIPSGTYTTGNSVSYGGQTWKVVKDNGSTTTLILASNLTTGAYTAASQQISSMVSNNAVYSYDSSLSKLTNATLPTHTTMPSNDSGYPFWTKTAGGLGYYVLGYDGSTSGYTYTKYSLVSSSRYQASGIGSYVLRTGNYGYSTAAASVNSAASSATVLSIPSYSLDTYEDTVYTSSSSQNGTKTYTNTNGKVQLEYRNVTAVNSLTLLTGSEFYDTNQEKYGAYGPTSVTGKTTAKTVSTSISLGYCNQSVGSTTHSQTLSSTSASHSATYTDVNDSDRLIHRSCLQIAGNGGKYNRAGTTNPGYSSYGCTSKTSCYNTYCNTVAKAKATQLHFFKYYYGTTSPSTTGKAVTATNWSTGSYSYNTASTTDCKKARYYGITDATLSIGIRPVITVTER